MQINEIKFYETVVIDGVSDTYFRSDRAGLRGVKVSITSDGLFIKFSPSVKDDTLVPLTGIRYMQVSKDRITGEMKTKKSPDVGTKNKSNS